MLLESRQVQGGQHLARPSHTPRQLRDDLLLGLGHGVLVVQRELHGAAAELRGDSTRQDEAQVDLRHVAAGGGEGGSGRPDGGEAATRVRGKRAELHGEGPTVFQELVGVEAWRV